MKNLLLVTFLAMTQIQTFADDIYRIEIGRDDEKASQNELSRRVRQLERAVRQLQQRVFDLETTPVAVPKAEKTWICTVKAMGESFTGTGETKAVAMEKSIKSCKGAKDGFFCKDPICQQ